MRVHIHLKKQDFDPTEKSYFEDNNPTDTVFVADYQEEIDDAPTHSWQLQVDYFVCEAPIKISESLFSSVTKEDTFILFSISWDDNWEKYVRQIHCAAQCSSHNVAKSLLLKKYAFDRLNNSGDLGFRDFIRGILLK